MTRRRGASRKSRRQAIRSLERRIEEHERKIAERPDSADVQGWRIEIAAFEEQIRRHERKLADD